MDFLEKKIDKDHLFLYKYIENGFLTMKDANDLVSKLKAKSGKVKTTSISLTDAHIEWLDQIATQSGEGITKSDVVRALIDEKRAEVEAMPA